jgi:linoleoyl-CoA desaturase
MNTETSNIKVKFNSSKGDQFLTVVRRRIEDHLKTHEIGRYATMSTHCKVILHLIVGVFLYVSIIMQLFPLWILFFMSMALGVISGFIGINLCHDSLHGAYSANPRLNRWFGYLYDVVGLSSLVWKLTHNGGHHTYTNIAGLDPDIDKPFLLRLTPSDKRHWFHRWQHYYIWLLYALVGINWIFYGDYAVVKREYHKISRNDLAIFFFFKLVNFIVFLGIPLALMTIPWWQILIGYLGYQIAGGFAVALIFQLAHVVELVEFPVPSSKGVISNSWGSHEMQTTANFGTDNRFLNYIVGGLNFQVEHHLVPYVSHVHYRAISPIVKSTAKEFGLPYNEHRTMTSAIASHWRLLRKLGNGTEIVK